MTDTVSGDIHTASDSQFVYVVDMLGTFRSDGLCVEVSSPTVASLTPSDFPPEEIDQLQSHADRRIAAAIASGIRDYSEDHGALHGARLDLADTNALRYVLTADLATLLLPIICSAGNCWLRPLGTDELVALGWDDGPRWRVRVTVTKIEENKSYHVVADLVREDVSLPFSALLVALDIGIAVTGNTACRIDRDIGQWMTEFGDTGVELNEAEIGPLLETFATSHSAPLLDLPEELRYETTAIPPVPGLRILGRDPKSTETRWLAVLPFYSYDSITIDLVDRREVIFDHTGKRIILRDPVLEELSLTRLADVGVRPVAIPGHFTARHAIVASKLDKIVRTLVSEGWHVEVQGRRYRKGGGLKLSVASGIDWFDLQGEVTFDGATASLPNLLAAARRNEKTILLSDGSYGLVSDELIARVRRLAGLAAVGAEGVRFKRSQVGLIDLLLSQQPEATFDATFEQARNELIRFERIEPAEPVGQFVGELRDYQKDGLGWLHFLQRFGFGGCLADDMGLGKTVQVLALLEARRNERDEFAPSLVVVPKSLIFNWIQEAKKFTPALTILTCIGPTRDVSPRALQSADIILTTYGTLRRDIDRLRKVRFDYVVLDEAQAIKNSTTDAAKGVRLLDATHRLAMTGTPVENHLGELWSLFEFLNPGLLGTSSAFRNLLAGGPASVAPPTEELARAIKPFILRRTKDKVARELPEKQEQTIYCELEPTERKLYNELRDHYRSSLLGVIDSAGIARSKMQILEALLRLRQAACHTGLVNGRRLDRSSSKIDLLLEQIGEAIEGGHKALVFSQFTSLLAIVRRQLDEAGIIYEYLDGQTRDREARVERFQNDPDCPLFLISLKAGGVGLNLTAAEYVFLLDPWWNPAVEAQAIDRAHRIGQKNRVFAYRIIARDTVEEKVLELQSTKRQLADAIVSASSSAISRLDRGDLELLLS